VEQDKVLGLILAGVVDPGDAVAQQIDGRMQRELSRRLTPRAAERLDMQWYVHSAPGAGGADGLADADPLLGEILSNQARRGVMDAFKRALDLAGSAALLLLLSPVFLFLALMVKLTSPGPVLFRQSRVGQLAKPFTMLKFRTMHVNNDPALHRQFVTEFIKSGANAQRAGDAPFKIKNDPRTTSIGRLLRRTSLDELPQLWNVFRGDMSLVGPRPPLRYELEQYRSWHWRRVLEAKPGMTGLWQVTGRSRTTFDEMVRLDLRYVRTRSLWTDIRILLATPRAVVTGKGAC
jgi:lipopolysaccharide/colanic/teichoic acid biosynthesis glycosyltransferase